MSDRPWSWFALCLAVIAMAQWFWQPVSEPYFNGDETRHVMTGVFVRDVILEGGITSPRAAAERYYAQHPCLGVLIWPPGFYGVEGLAMLVFGPWFSVGRVLVFAYFAFGAAYLFALVKSTHGLTTAVITVLTFGFSRIVFTHSGVIMLEVPTLACFLGAIWHLERYLQSSSRRHLMLLGLWTLAMALHRYDAVIIVPYFGLRLLFERKLSLLVRRDVLIVGGCVAILAAPFYYLMIREIGGMQSHAASVGTDRTVSTGLFRAENFVFYPQTVPFQFGHVAAAMIVMGLLRSFFPDRRAMSRPYWSLAAATYLFFSPLAELEPRHAISWSPAFALFAADAARSLPRRWMTVTASILLVGSTAGWTLKQPQNWIAGYADAAEYLLPRIDDSNPVLFFDGLNDGNFIYQVRLRDVNRSVWVVRGDKFFYSVRSSPDAGYVEWTRDDATRLKLLHELDPAFLVLEEPPALPPGKRILPEQVALRRLVKEHPDEFRRETTIEVRNGNQETYDGVTLVIYRKLKRNPDRGPIRMNMFWQGSSIVAPLPGVKK